MPIGGFGDLIEGHSRDILGIEDFTNDSQGRSSSATADTFGTWSELQASLSYDIMITELTVHENWGLDTYTNDYFELEIGIGAVASEVRIFAVCAPMADPSGAWTRPRTFTVNRRVPAGSRVSWRIRDTDTSTIDMACYMNYIEL